MDVNKEIDNLNFLLTTRQLEFKSIQCIKVTPSLLRGIVTYC